MQSDFLRSVARKKPIRGRSFSPSAAVALAFAMTVSSVARTSSAEGEPSCSTGITKANVVSCALRASLALRSEEQGKEVLEARRVAVSPLLPSNPLLAVTAARRAASGGDPTALNWYATLSQEVEVAGQRGARRDAVDAALVAQGRRTLVARRRVAFDAWVAFFEASSAHEERSMAQRLTAVVDAIAVVARAKANEGVLPPIDADVAEASSLRVARARYSAELRVIASSAALASLVGLDPSKPIVIQGDLTPLAGIEALARGLSEAAALKRPEVAAAEAERRAQELRADAFRRARIPNPTVSIFVHNDGFNEQVLGVGVAVPIPLPSPVGRTYAGEIAEAEAEAKRARTETEKLQREIRLEVTSALAAYESKQRELQAFTPERMQRAEESLRRLSLEIQAGRLNVRDALLAQQALVELLQAHVATRRDLAIASVDLARASGMALEGAAQ